MNASMRKKLPIFSAHALLVFAAALVFFSGCDKQAQKAARYNDQIVHIQSGLVHTLNQLDSTLNALEIDEAMLVLERFQREIAVGLRALDSLGDFEGDDAFRQATHSLLLGYDEAANTHYPELLAVLALPDTAFTPEAQKQAFAAEAVLIARIRDAHQRFEEDQRNFGKRYRLVFERN